MKTILYILLLAAALLLPAKKSDVGKLQPIEVVAIYMEENELVIQTDTEDVGRGANVTEALENLKQTTPGIVYLDTADYLLVSSDTQAQVREISQYLKDSVKICIDDHGVNLADAAFYLSVHEPKTTIQMWRQGAQLQTLEVVSDRFFLE